MAFSFDPIFATDPNNPTNVASNASIVISDPADPGNAPVTITDVTGSPLPNPVTVNTAHPVRRLEHDVGIGYGDDIALAKQVMLDTLARLPEARLSWCVVTAPRLDSNGASGPWVARAFRRCQFGVRPLGLPPFRPFARAAAAFASLVD